MLFQAYAASAIALLALAGLVASNLMFDRGVDPSLSRRVPGALGGVAFLAAVLWLDPWAAVAVSGVLTLFTLVLRLGFRRGLRGVRGSFSTQAYAEVTFPLAGTFSLAIGWGLLGDRWLAFVPIAFMAWGDNVAGLARATIWQGYRARRWPSMAMLGVCLATALLFEPFWMGAVGALVATAAERFRPTAPRAWDDNLIVVALSLAVMAVLVDIGR